MKKIFSLVFILIVVAIPIYDTSQIVRANDYEVTHLFTHALIAHSDVAFTANNPMRVHYDKDCLTVNEFKTILNNLYMNNYILVSPKDIYTIKDGKAVKKPFHYKNKKPLLLSFDDINYYNKKMDLGMNDKIIIDKNGNLATFTKNSKPQISYDNEVITILENFIMKHSDFSYKNAKGTICLTGFDGILGYRTNRDSKTKEEEIKRVTPIVERLKNLNWNFACHSYGHYHMKRLSDSRFILDTQRWINEVEPIIGKTQIYVFPFGEYEIEKANAISKKHEFLKNFGFKMFWGVGGTPFYGYLPFNANINSKTLFMDRIPMDGYSLRHINMENYFDVKKVYDEIRDNYYINK